MKNFKETLYDAVAQEFRIDKLYFESKTAHQHLMIFHNASLGRVMTLDGIVQTLTRDGFESFEEFVIENRKNATTHAERTRQIEPMTRCGAGDIYRPETKSPMQATGDRWGHTSTVPIDDSR